MRIAETWKSVRQTVIRSPRKAIAFVVTIPITAASLIQISNAIDSRIGIYYSQFFVIVLAGIVYYIIFTYMVSDLGNIYKVPNPPNYLYHEVLQKWHFNNDGSRDTYCKKVLVFFNELQAGDLVDTLFGSLDINYDALRYSTEDATVTRISQVRQDAINIFWQPKVGSIKIGDLYEHVFQYHFPAGQGLVPKSTTLASLAHVRRTIIEITSDHDISDLMVGDNENHIEFWNANKIFADGNDRLLNPIKQISANSATLEFNNLSPGESFFITFKIA